MYSDGCVHKDDMRPLFENRIIPAQTIVDSYLSSSWKKFFDMTFFFQHRPLVAYKEAALIVSGPLRQEPDLLQIFDAYMYLTLLDVVGVVSDEENDSKKTSEAIKDLAATIDR